MNWGPFGAPTHTAHVTQNWLRSNCSDFINKNEWLPNLPNLNPLDCHVRWQRWKLAAKKDQNNPPDVGCTAAHLDCLATEIHC